MIHVTWDPVVTNKVQGQYCRLAWKRRDTTRVVVTLEVGRVMVNARFVGFIWATHFGPHLNRAHSCVNEVLRFRAGETNDCVSFHWILVDFEAFHLVWSKLMLAIVAIFDLILYKKNCPPFCFLNWHAKLGELLYSFGSESVVCERSVFNEVPSSQLSVDIELRVELDPVQSGFAT